MFEVGRLCIKIAGRDANKKCVIIKIMDKRFVMIDGETRRRKCNVSHLEATETLIKIKENATHEEIKKEFDKLGLKTKETKPKEIKEKPKRVRKKQVKPAEKEKKQETKEKTTAKNKETKETKPKEEKKETNKIVTKTTKKSAKK